MTEHEAAKAWRYRHGLTMPDLAALTGYSVETIFIMERGRNSVGKPPPPHVWRRYKLACLAVATLKHCKIDSVDRWEWS